MAALKSRGPNAQSDAIVDGMTFGHTRLAVIGLGSAGAQPMVDERDVLIFNGEIYNYLSLADELGINATSDTQVMFAIGKRGWREWLPKLRGMFAFVHLDRSTKVVTAARDPFGMKPLYATVDAASDLRIGSTAASVARLMGSRVADPTAIAGFLATGYFPAGESAFAGLQKLEPGKLYSWDLQGKTHQMSTLAQEFWPGNAASVPAALADSVRAHLVSDIEVGVLLSGGVDSTLLAALATEERGPIKTFCLTNPTNPTIDEAQYARANARQLQSEHHEIPVTPSLLLGKLDSVIASTGEPIGDLAYLPLAVLSEYTSQEVSVALAGEGADELFAGYRRYDAERFIECSRIGRAGRLIARSMRTSARRGYGRSSAARVVRAMGATEPALAHSLLMGGQWSLLTNRGAAPVNDALTGFQRSWSAASVGPWALGFSPARAFDTRVWLPNVYLEKSDRASMMFGLELRTPFLDREVALAVRGINPNDTNKQPLRNMLHKLLPDVQLPKRKKGLAVDLSDQHRRLQMTALESLRDPYSTLNSIGPMDRAAIENAVSEDKDFAFRVAALRHWEASWL